MTLVTLSIFCDPGRPKLAWLAPQPPCETGNGSGSERRLRGSSLYAETTAVMSLE
jgi:hypothetical protein